MGTQVPQGRLSTNIARPPYILHLSYIFKTPTHCAQSCWNPNPPTCGSINAGWQLNLPITLMVGLEAYIWFLLETHTTCSRGARFFTKSSPPKPNYCIYGLQSKDSVTMVSGGCKTLCTYLLHWSGKFGFLQLHKTHALPRRTYELSCRSFSAKSTLALSWLRESDFDICLARTNLWAMSFLAKSTPVLSWLSESDLDFVFLLNLVLG